MGGKKPKLGNYFKSNPTAPERQDNAASFATGVILFADNHHEKVTAGVCNFGR